MASPSLLLISVENWGKMKNHVASIYPEEACGLIAGLAEEILEIIPIENDRHSSSQFFMNPGALLRGLKMVDRLRLELLGIYHSHPHGPAEPSARDKAEALAPNLISVILAPIEGDLGQTSKNDKLNANAWQVRGFFINRQNISEIELLPGRQREQP
jgi:proteasome lid subunit RPN8/RPN11